MPSKTVRKSSSNTTPDTTSKAEDKLWSVLRDNPGSTTAKLASKAEIGKSTTARFLAKWANDGSAARTPGTGPRAADTWTIPADVPPIDAMIAKSTSRTEPSEMTTPALDDADASALRPPDAPELVAVPDEVTTEQGSRRLPPGGLHGMVEDFLLAHPNEEFGPGAIAKSLGRSSGAVSNTLDKMAASGLAVQTRPKPKRFQLAPAGHANAHK